MTDAQNIIKTYLEHLLTNIEIIEKEFGKSIASEQFDIRLDTLTQLIQRYKGTDDRTQPSFFTIREAIEFLGDRGFIIINGNNVHKPDLLKITGFVISERDISKLEWFIQTRVTIELAQTP